MTQKTVIETEFGYVKLIFDGAELLSVTKVAAKEPGDAIDSSILGPVTDCIAGKRDGREIPIQFNGSAFQVRAWNAIRSVKAGEVISYAELARRAGNIRATRAVAAACGKNPCAIVVPCHRIIRRDNGLGGFFWGLDVKRALLKREGLGVSEDCRIV